MYVVLQESTTSISACQVSYSQSSLLTCAYELKYDSNYGRSSYMPMHGYCSYDGVLDLFLYVDSLPAVDLSTPTLVSPFLDIHLYIYMYMYLFVIALYHVNFSL